MLSIQTNLDLANQMDINDQEANEKSMSKVGWVRLFWCLFGAVFIYLLDCGEWP